MSKLRIIIGLFIVFAGVAGLSYPYFSNVWNQSHASRLISEYETAVSFLDDHGYEQVRSEAEAYNEALSRNPERFLVTEESHAEYESVMDVTGTGILCYLEIPSLDIRLPVYHTTDETVLQVAAGHMEGTSLPVGGASVHSVISGHSGLVTAQLFTQLEELEEGDVFYIHVLDETRIYEVKEIHTVLPDETDLLAIRPGEDLVTLVTCTPYGVNSHRLLVTGSFAGLLSEEDAAEAVIVNREAVGMELIMLHAAIGILVILISGGIIVLIRRRLN